MLHKSRPIIRLHPEHLERVLVFWIFLEILLCESLFYLFFVGRINKRDYSTFETSS